MLLEILGTILALIYVVLSAKKIRICWAFSCLAASLYFVVFWQSDLYNLALLQLFIIASAIYGFFFWGKGAYADFEFLDLPQKIMLAVATLSSGILNHQICKIMIPEQANFLDSLIACASVFASLLASRKKIDSWYYWMLVNTLGIYLFIKTELYPTALVYCIFLTLSFYGLQSWSKCKKS